MAPHEGSRVDTILLVEDDPAIARLFLRVFRLDGTYELHHAANGKEAIAMARRSKPDIMLLDIMMPEMNGLEVLDALQKDPETRGIPVAVMTNLVGDENVNVATRKGAFAYLVKSSIEPDDLVEKIRSMLTLLRSV